MPTEPASPDLQPALDSDTDLDFEDLLGKTSRTFALSIPHLPQPTRREVTLAYLLFRIADTFEDAATWPRERRRAALEQFGRLLEAPAPAEAERLAALWSETVPCAQPGYRELLVRLPDVLDAAYALGEQASALIRSYTLRTVYGMADFVDRMTDRGELVLADLADLRHYCYVVAGIVGELLTELLLLDRPELLPVAEELRARSRDFGEGLQLVNILKDAASDATEGRTYLPADVPREEVFALARHDLGLAAEYVRTIQLAGAARGVVAFNALPARLALASLDRLEEKGPGAKVSRPELWKIIGRLEKALDAGEPPVPAPDARELAEIAASIWTG
ncbi:MAG TPA: squalene/phytoene synthase family protein [Thermoanaerobaculia bacterium]|jgi:farnesyl-diphosphate farnesyltransferase|nr:squalene/phytoene synthase family protein [Thermoanaerobaculia bacterium]